MMLYVGVQRVRRAQDGRGGQWGSHFIWIVRGRPPGGGYSREQQPRGQETCRVVEVLSHLMWWGQEASRRVQETGR